MRLSMNTLLATGATTLAAFSLLTLAPSAAAQTFPTKPMTMIVAFPAGGGSDVLGRAVGKGMQEALGQAIIVENVVGVGGSLGVLKAGVLQLVPGENICYVTDVAFHRDNVQRIKILKRLK